MDGNFSNSEESIFVGIPCFNRPDGLARTIRDLRDQTHQNWTALICDNASTDGRVRTVAEEAVQADSRFKYLCHSENIGAFRNFRFAAEQSDQPYFMWGSDDDLRHPDHMSSNLRLLAQHPDAAMASSSISIININGEQIFDHTGFSRFTSTGRREDDIKAFLDDPEKQGKANLIYGLFRTPALLSTICECWDDANLAYYGADFVFLFAFACRHQIAGHDERHLLKRQPTRKKYRLHWRHPRSYRASRPADFQSYVDRHKLVAPTPELASMAESILRRRQKERFLYAIPVLHRLLARSN